jgi:hypothetical protein
MEEENVEPKPEEVKMDVSSPPFVPAAAVTEPVMASEPIVSVSEPITTVSEPIKPP